MKSLFASKTFWFNILGATMAIGGVLPEKYAMPVLAVANIGLRLITTEPVTIVKSKEE